MQNWCSCLGKLLQIVQNSTACTPTVERHDPPGGRATFCQNVLKHQNLALPVAAELGAAIKADLTDVARLGQKPVEQWQFVLPLVSQLRMQTEPSPDALSVCCQCGRSTPG